MRLLRKWLVAIVIAAAPALADAPATPKTSTTALPILPAAFEVDDSALKIGPGEPSGKAVFLLTLKGEGASQACSLDVKPVPIPDPPHVEIGFTSEAQSVKSTARSWLVTADVKAMPLAVVPLSRRLVATCGPYSDIIHYTLDNSLAAQFVWKFVAPLAERRWDGTEPLALDVFVGVRPATEVQLMPPQLSESEGFRTISSDFRLCATLSGKCDGKPLTLEANHRHALWIRRDSATPPSPGAYKGNIVIVAAEKPEGETFATTLHVSSNGLRIWGSVLIFAGIALSFFLMQLLRSWSDRAAMLRPAALLLDQLRSLSDKRHQIDSRLEEIDAVSRRISNELSKHNIVKFLPYSIAFYQPLTGVPAVGESYQEFLTRLGGEIGSLSIIIERGVTAALAEVSRSSPDAERRAVEGAIGDLDLLAVRDISKPDIVASTVRDRVAAMHGDIAKAREAYGLVSDGAPATVDVGYTSKHLAFESFAINLGGWLIFALLSWAVGTYLLVTRNNDFGQAQDLLICFLWGLGLPSAGQGLTSLTSSGIGQSLGLTVTRA